MIELVGLLAVGFIQLSITVFGYYAAVGHVNRMLDIEEPDSPQIVQNIREDLFSKEALTVEDIDEIENWEEFGDAETDEQDDS